MNAISGFFTGFMLINLIAVIALLAVTATWTIEFFTRNHRVRVAKHEPLVPYYRGLALGH